MIRRLTLLLPCPKCRVSHFSRGLCPVRRGHWYLGSESFLFRNPGVTASDPFRGQESGLFSSWVLQLKPHVTDPLFTCPYSAWVSPSPWEPGSHSSTQTLTCCFLHQTASTPDNKPTTSSGTVLYSLLFFLFLECIPLINSKFTWFLCDFSIWCTSRFRVSVCTQHKGLLFSFSLHFRFLNTWNISMVQKSKLRKGMLKGICCPFHPFPRILP